jgi:nucleoside-diphosphate-sugar epimerase
MKSIAILGASSQIAGDLILWLARQSYIELHLFVRNCDAMLDWLAKRSMLGRAKVYSYHNFGRQDLYFSVINFVGAGDPAKILNLGSDFLELTYQYDSLALEYLRDHQSTRYLFISSGAAYGSNFNEPVDEASPAIFALNAYDQSTWYGMAKAHAECRHRARNDLAIMDIRIFNYISENQELAARFLITDIIRSIRDDEVLITSSDQIMRDYLYAQDFCILIDAILNAPPSNDVIDCFSKAPVGKGELLNTLQEVFNLKYSLLVPKAGVGTTGQKPCYYSLNRRASSYGYAPKFTSLEGILKSIHIILENSV